MTPAELTSGYLSTMNLRVFPAFAFALFYTVLATGQLNIQFVGQLNYQTTRNSNLSNLWGYTDEFGNEYALLGVCGVDDQNPGGIAVVDLSDPSAARILNWNSATQAYQALAPESLSDPRGFGERYPLRWNVPVLTLWGSFSSATPQASSILNPMTYLGNLKRLFLCY